MAYDKKFEFANFTCKFGDKHVLLDLFDEVVFPAFQERRFIRKAWESEFFFVDTQLINVKDQYGKQHLCLTGRLVRNTKLKRDQIFRDEKGILFDHDELETAPSSIFTLILENHRLIYVKEISGAPDIDLFRSTCIRFLRAQHKAFIDKLAEENKKKREQNKNVKRLTKKFFIEKYPYPDLRTTPLTDKQELRDFIDKFQRIDEFVIKLLPTNQEEIDNDDFWSKLEKINKKMRSTNSAIKFSNKKEGLDVEEVYEQTQSTTELANSDINLKGYDEYGNSIKGNNKDFHLTVKAGQLSLNIEDAAPSLVAIFLNLIETGKIQAPKVTEKAIRKVQSIKERLVK